MKTFSIRELHLRTGAWVKRAAELRPGYKRLQGKLTGGTDSVTIVAEGREGR